MDSNNKIKITVHATVNKPIDKVWDLWSLPEHITKWNNASDDWHTPHAENDLRTGGKFMSRMEAKDGSMGFDFGGIYENVITNELIEYVMDDGRKVRIEFSVTAEGVKVLETFEAETTNSIELQQTGWQSIMDNFKRYAEGI